MDRQTFFDVKPKKKNEQAGEITRLILPYNAQFKKVRYIVNRHWHYLTKDRVIGHLIPPTPQITYTKAPNLGLLVAPTIKKKGTQKQSVQQWIGLKGFHRCGTCVGCRATKFPKKTNLVKSTTNNHQSMIKEFLTCNSRGVIYLIECPCKKQYVGRTKRALKVRIAEHVGNIKKGYEKHSLSSHFKTTHSQDPTGLTFTALEKVENDWRGGDYIKKMSRIESKYIFEFNTLIPLGLNAEMEVFGFL